MIRRENILRLLSPEQIAFIGGKDLAGAIRNCEDLGYEGSIRVVNPKYGEIAGHPCYPSVADLPEAPDAAFVGVRRELTVELVRELAQLGAGGCVCHAAGFAELGPEGEALQESLVEAAGEMAVVGPNCYGLLNYLDGTALWPDLHGGERVERGVAIVSQSGNISLNATMTERSLSISHVVSIGNQAVLGLGDYVDSLVEDPRVEAIGMYIEGIGDVSGFSRTAARALRKGIPLVALKSGTSELGSRIALSHTSSLSAPDELYDALFERLGIVRTSSVAEFVETLKLLANSGPLEGRRLGVLAGSGGDSAMFADLAYPLGLVLPDFSEQQSAALREQLGGFVSISNPLDYNTAVWGDREELQRCFTTVMEGDFDATVLTLDYPRPGSGGCDPWDAASDALLASQKHSGKPAVVACTMPELLPREVRERLLSGGVVPLQGLPEAVAALHGAAWYGERRREILEEPEPHLLPAGALDVLREPRFLDEWESKRQLASSGLRVPEGRLVSAAGAAEAAIELGFPVVVKAVGTGLEHKSDRGAVVLDLQDAGAVEAAVERLGAAGLPNGTGGERSFLVERMVTGAVAELIIGLQRDQRFGLALILGSGGTMVNLVDDSVTLLLPASRRDISRALDSLRVTRLIDGFRGGTKGDREALLDAVLAIAAFAEQRCDRLQELDINPLLILASGEGAVAVDGLIRMQME